MSDKINREVFCNVPWHKIFIRSTGHYSPCCVMKTNLDLSTIQDMTPRQWFHSDQANKLRLDMLQDQPVADCAKCYYNESIGYDSSRIRDNYKSFVFPGQQFERSYEQSPWHGTYEQSRATQGQTDLDPVEYMVSLGNECNLACKMCRPIWSSRIADKYQSWNLLDDRLDVRNNWTADETLWQRFIHDIEQTPGLMRLVFLGGETMMNKRFHHIVDTLLAQGRTNVVLHFITNATLYNKTLIEKLKQFQNLYIEFSIESIHSNNHYIRQGSDTQQVLANILNMQDALAHNTNFTISSAPQALSINNYDQLIRWALAHRIPIQGHVVVDPDYYNITVLPRTLRMTLVPQYRALEAELLHMVNQQQHTIAFGSDPNRIAQVLLQETQSMLTLLQAPEPDNIHQLQTQLIAWMQRWDQEFDLDARQYYPEYRAWFEQMGYHV